MEKIQEDDNRAYILKSKTNIDELISKNDYKKAFFLLVLVLERLDDDDKAELIDYYSRKMNDMHSWRNCILHSESGK